MGTSDKTQGIGSKSQTSSDIKASPTPDASNIKDNTNIEKLKPEEDKGFLGNFFDTIRKEIRDVSYLEVVTAIGDVKANVNPDAELVILGLNKDANVTIKARTRIELDGDIMVWLPTNNKEQDGEITINQQIMDIHKENVELAVHNWNQFMKNIFDVLKIIIDMTGLSKSQVEGKFNQPLPPKSEGEEKVEASNTKTPAESLKSK